MKKFKIGDKVRIRKGVTDYDVTKPGSEGIIMSTSSHNSNVLVEFYKITGERGLGTLWDIRTETLELIEKADNRIIQYGIVKFCKENYK